MNPTLYDILGVPHDASREEIRSAWRDAADRFEPGTGGSTRQFRMFNEAAEVLLDPERRAAYDEGLAESSGHGGAGPTAVPGPPVPGSSRAGAAAAAPSAGSVVEPVERRRLGRGRQKPEGAGRPSAAATVTAPEGDGAGRGVSWLVIAVLGVLTALAVGVAGYLTVQTERAEAYEEAVDRAPAAAENAAAAVLSYDYESLEADRDAAAKFLSPDYRGEYVETFDKLVVDNATETKSTVEAEVLASSAMTSGADRDPERVRVLLFVNQSSVNAGTEDAPSVALNRVRFDMVDVDGTWLVDGITSY